MVQMGHEYLGQSPWDVTLTLAHAARHALLYVLKSEPQTGTYSRVQMQGVEHSPWDTTVAPEQMARQPLL